MRRIAALCAAVLMVGAAPVGAGASTDPVTDWLTSLQYVSADPLAAGALGAIRRHHTPGAHTVPFVGPTYFQVAPYWSSLGVTGLLGSGAPQALDVAEGWIDWYLAHLLPGGLILDHWYLEDGTAESVCGTPVPQNPAAPAAACGYRDADDSYASTLLIAAQAYRAAGGARADAFLARPGVRRRLEAVAGVILALQDPADGLTWARADWPFKYLLDNSESFAGLDAIATIEAEVYDDAAAAQRYTDAAEAVRAGIISMIDPVTGLFGWAKWAYGPVQPADLDVWYPDTVALVWPHLFGVIDAGGAVARAQMAAVNTWRGAPKGDWTTEALAGFHWPAVGAAALLAGDPSAAAANAATVRCAMIDSSFDARFTPADAGWLLSTLTSLGGAPPPC